VCWLVYTVFANARVFWVIPKTLLGCSGWMLGCCYMVSRVFCVVSHVLRVVTRVYTVSMVFWVVSRMLLRCSEWFLRQC